MRWYALDLLSRAASFMLATCGFRRALARAADLRLASPDPVIGISNWSFSKISNSFVNLQKNQIDGHELPAKLPGLRQREALA